MISSNKLLNYLIVLYAFSIPFSLDLIRIFAPLILIVWIKEGGLKGKFIHIKKEPLFITFGLFLIILILSLLWTDPENLKFGIKYITRYWYLLPMFAIATPLSKPFIPHTLSAFIAGMAVNVTVSYLVYLHIIPFDFYYAEGASPLMHHTLYSIFLVITIGIVLIRLFDSKKRYLKLLYFCLFILFSVNLFINIGRAGQFLFFPVVVIALLYRYKLTLRSTVLVSSTAILLFSLAVTLSPVFKQKLQTTYHNLKHISYDTSLGARIGLNIVAKEIFFKHPILGVGAGDYLSEKAKLIDQRYPERTYVRFLVHYHNQYAELAVISGIFGLGLYLILLIQVSLIPIRSRSYRFIKYLFIVVFAMTSLIDAMFHLNRPLSLFALFVGLLLAQKYQERSPSEQ